MSDLITAGIRFAFTESDNWLASIIAFSAFEPAFVVVNRTFSPNSISPTHCTNPQRERKLQSWSQLHLSLFDISNGTNNNTRTRSLFLKFLKFAIWCLTNVVLPHDSWRGVYEKQNNFNCVPCWFCDFVFIYYFINIKYIINIYINKCILWFWNSSLIMLLFSFSETLLTVLTVCSTYSRMFFAVTLQLIALLCISMYVCVACLVAVRTGK